jgi:hypothetical protein
MIVLCILELENIRIKNLFLGLSGSGIGLNKIELLVFARSSSGIKMPACLDRTPALLSKIVASLAGADFRATHRCSKEQG